MAIRVKFKPPTQLTLSGFFRDMKPLWEMVLGGVLAFFLAEAAMHLQWIAANVTGHAGVQCSNFLDDLEALGGLPEATKLAS